MVPQAIKEWNNLPDVTKTNKSKFGQLLSKNCLTYAKSIITDDQVSLFLLAVLLAFTPFCTDP